MVRIGTEVEQLPRDRIHTAAVPPCPLGETPMQVVGNAQQDLLHPHIISSEPADSSQAADEVQVLAVGDTVVVDDGDRLPDSVARGRCLRIVIRPALSG